MNVSYDKVITVSGKLHQSHEGPRIVFESDIQCVERSTRVLSIGTHNYVVRDIEGGSGLLTPGGKVLLVLFFSGIGKTPHGESYTVHDILFSYYCPSVQEIQAVSEMVAELTRIGASDQDIFHAVWRLSYAESKGRR